MSDHDPSGDPTRVDTPVTDPTMAMPAATGAPPPVGRPPTGQPPAEPPDRRPWIIVGILALIVAAGLAVLLLQDDDEAASRDSSTTSSTVEDTTTTSEATTTTSSTTTTTAATTTSPPATVAPELCVSSDPDEPEPTAEVLYQAYTLGDRGCAANLATSEAVDQLFAIPGAGGGWTFAGCFDQEDPDPHTQCSFTFDGGSTSFRMSYSDTEGWTVYEVFQVAD